MQISYELTPQDLVAFSRYHSFASPTARRQRSGCLIAIVALMLGLPAFILATSNKPLVQTARDIWPLLAGPVFFVIVMIPYIKWRTASMSSRLVNEGRNAGFYGACTLALGEAGIKEEKESGESTRRWPAVERIVVTPDYVFVYTAGIEAFVIPVRVFRDSDEASAFQQLLADNSGVTPQVLSSQ